MHCREVATLKGCSESTVSSACKSGKIRAELRFMPGRDGKRVRQWSIDPEAAEKWVPRTYNGKVTSPRRKKITVDRSGPFPLNGAVAFLRAKRDALDTAIKALESVK